MTFAVGTFARVWLVKLRNAIGGDRDKVYALKVLRKVEGWFIHASNMHVSVLTLISSVVVRLKQVDHVNHERSVLADVAGHPFITTLITSFSDYDSLYMLVGSHPEPIEEACKTNR